MTYTPWSARSWLVAAAIAVPVVLLQSWLEIDYPSWVRWICIGIPFLIGGALLISPDLAAMKRPALARLLGAVMVFAAAVGAYELFTKTSQE